MDSSFPAAINIASFVIGQLLVTRRRWMGFLLWAGANLMIAVTCVMRNDAPTACMFLVYFAANVYSTILWFRQSRTTDTTS